MEIREKYDHDYTAKYYPNVSQQAFYRDSIKYSQLRLLIFQNEDIQSHNQIQNIRDLGLALSVPLALVLIYHYDRLPLFRRVQNKWLQFPIKLFIFGAPFSLVYIATQELKEKQLWDQYIQSFKGYILYKQTGNVQHLNRKVEFSER